MVGLLYTNDQLLKIAATYRTQKKHNGRASMSSVGFETAIPTIKRLQTHALGRTAIGIG